jgi:pilus assembly protein Flp/PilA
MQDGFLNLYIKMQSLKDALVTNQSGQDLIEYALVAALIALAATAGMKTLATSISNAFTSAGTKLSTYTS